MRALTFLPWIFGILWFEKLFISKGLYWAHRGVTLQLDHTVITSKGTTSKHAVLNLSKYKCFVLAKERKKKKKERKEGRKKERKKEERIRFTAVLTYPCI